MSTALSNWQEHEDHVASLYEALGYDVTKNIDISGKQVDLICEKWLPGAGKTILYVDCKHTVHKKTSPISNSNVEAFISTFHARKNPNKWNYGILLSNQPFSQSAKATAAPHHDIILKTISDLEEDIFLIRHYLYSIIHNVDSEKEEILTGYIPLLATNIDDNVLPTGKAIDLLTFVKSWLHSPNNAQLCLLGDFGSGKTTFLRYLHYHCAKQYLSGQKGMMPLYVPLRDYNDVKSGFELIQRFFQMELNISIPQKYFERLLEAGRFLILLDGFDEMSRSSDQETRQRNYIKLAQLAVGKSKIIITCRPSYFVTYHELTNILDSFRERVGISAPPMKGTRKIDPDADVLTSQLQSTLFGREVENLIGSISRVSRSSEIKHLCLFSKNQIKSYLNKHEQDIRILSENTMTSESLMNRIEDIYDLQDLAQRPILLKLIVYTLPKFRISTDNKYIIDNGIQKLKFAEITPSILYYVYTESELAREYNKANSGIILTRKQKKTFFSALAAQMCSEENVILEYKKIANAIREMFAPEDTDIDLLLTDIRTCSFISRDKNDCFRFTHKSFLEFFAALHILPDLSKIKKARIILSERVIPNEVLYFLGDSIPAFSEVSIRILKKIYSSMPNDQSTNVCRHNILNLLNYARVPITRIDGAHIFGLVYLKLLIGRLECRKSDIGKVEFKRSNIDLYLIDHSSTNSIQLESSKIVKMKMNDSKLSALNMSNSELELSAVRCEISELSGYHSRIYGGYIKDSYIKLGSFFDSSIKDLIYTGCIVSSLSHMDISTLKSDGITFENCVFIDMMCNDNFFNMAAFKDCTFIRCTLAERASPHNVKGSRGFFISSKKGVVSETSGYPAVWNKSHITSKQNEVASLIRKITDDSSKEERPVLLSRLTWTQAMLHVFPLYGISHDRLSMKVIKDRINWMDRDRAYLIDNQ